MINIGRMDIKWVVSDYDIERIRRFIDENDNLFVENRISRDINRENIHIDRNSILRGMIICLITSQQRSGPNTPVSVFLRLDPFRLPLKIFLVTWMLRITRGLPCSGTFLTGM